MRSLAMLLLLLAIGTSILSIAQQHKVTNRIPFPGEQGWDYLFADDATRHLYVSHGDEVEIIDLDSLKPIGKLTGLNRVHGIAIADDMHHGFISNGGTNEVVVFDTKSNAEIQRVKTGANPDGILYDASSNRVFAFNGSSHDATVIDAAATAKAVGTIPLGGKPEFSVRDGRGNVYVNIEDKSEIVQINSSTMRAEKRWPLEPCEEPSGLAIDTNSKRLFSVCSNQMMAVVDIDSGRVIATVPIGKGPDAVVFDPARALILSSNGQDGTITVVKEGPSAKFAVIETFETERSARTMTLDNKTHNLFLSAAQFGATPAGTPGNQHPWPKIVPGTFHVLVVSPN
jgi:YVTN family beta-propeller protein